MRGLQRVKGALTLLLMGVFCACGRYTVQPCKGDLKVSVPYVEGDLGGQLTHELIQELSSSGPFQYVHSGGELIVKVTILSEEDETIGYRYQRDDKTQAIKRHLTDIEGRRKIAAEVSLIRALSEEVLIGPTVIKAEVDYDYGDGTRAEDLYFVDKEGTQRSTLEFSRGQLDSIEGAQDAAAMSLSRLLARKIVARLVSG